MSNKTWNAYKERNLLVCVLTKLWPSHLAKHPATDKEWEAEWRNIVCVHTPKGQATWHIHDSEVRNFKHLNYRKDHWDGHTTSQKYNRLAKMRIPKELTRGGKWRKCLLIEEND